MQRPNSRPVPGALALGALLAGLASCAFAEPRPQQAFSSDMAETLAEVIELHGWPCGPVTAFTPDTDGGYAVSCAGGQQYTVHLDLAREWNHAQRQTGLRPLIDVTHEVSRLEADDAAERLRATQTLVSLGPDGRAGTPFLVKALSDPDPRVRAGAARALGAIGEDAADAVSALEIALQEDNVAVSRAAADALTQIRE